MAGSPGMNDPGTARDTLAYGDANVTLTKGTLTKGGWQAVPE